MFEDEVRKLLDKDTNSFEGNDIPSNILVNIDEIILTHFQKISNEVLSIYKKFVIMKQEAPEDIKYELFKAFRNFYSEQLENGNLIDALFLLRFLAVKSKLLPHSYNDFSQIFMKLGYKDFALWFLNLYGEKETNIHLKLLTFANFYNLELKDYKTAINYYEQYLKIDSSKAVIYNILASLYSKLYGDISLKDQIYYFEKAYNLNPQNKLTLHGLAFSYERLKNKELCNKYYQELLENNPTESDYYNYGLFLISCGEFKIGHDYLRRRFFLDNINTTYPISGFDDKKWDLKTDISDKILLVCYEQGFGDTFMYCRFLPFLKKYAKKVIFVAQKNLYELLNYSKTIADDVEIISDDVPIETLEFDYHMALLDVPYVLQTSIENIPFTDKYIELPGSLVEKYASKNNIKPTKKLKVGIAYQGDRNANYNDRDINISKFNRLFKSEDIEFYSLQFEEDIKNTKIINLGKTFKSFTDTACAIKNMDLVITTDNVILNLAGALGIKTYGLFNFYTNYRWYKLNGENVGWYKSVKPFQVEENNRWSIVFKKISREIEQEFFGN